MMEDYRRKNINRGYQKLRIWNDAIELYRITTEIFNDFPFEYKKIVSQMIASVDSIHRNIAEGYCRRSIKEYMHFLYIASGSLGDTVSALHAYHLAGQINNQQFEQLDALSFKLENGLIRLINALEVKKLSGNWNDSYIIKEMNIYYDEEI